MKHNNSLTVQQWLQYSQKVIHNSGIPTGRLDSLVLLEDELGIDRSKILAYPDMIISVAHQKVLKQQITKRIKNIPLAYIRNKVEFYGREFIITPAVMVPRPETETMIELFLLIPFIHSNDLFIEYHLSKKPIKEPHLLKTNLPIVCKNYNLDSSEKLKKLKNKRLVKAADIGSGSGVIGTTLKLETPHIAMDLIDIDDKALEISKMNSVKYSTDLSFIVSDLLALTDYDYDILLCNLPYVPDNYPINSAASNEPKSAIFGGSDGLYFYRKLLYQLKSVDKFPLYILIEIFPFQRNFLYKFITKFGYRIYKEKDFVIVFCRYYLLE